VKVLQRRVANDEGQLSLNFEGDTCLGAQVADLIQGTWMVVDQLSVATQAARLARRELLLARSTV